MTSLGDNYHIFNKDLQAASHEPVQNVHPNLVAKPLENCCILIGTNILLFVLLKQ